MVEPYCGAKEHTEFAVTVLGTAKGPVALLPSEVASYDMWDDIEQADMEMEAYHARQEVMDCNSDSPSLGIISKTCMFRTY